MSAGARARGKGGTISVGEGILFFVVDGLGWELGLGWLVVYVKVSPASL